MNSYAPVLITTLNRFEHFSRCVESLSKCTYADQTELFIALDFPFNDTQRLGYNKIKDYLPLITGFKDVIVLERSINYGFVKNIFSAIDIVFEKNNRIILSEDDNEFSPNFLDYINKGLEKFESNTNISAVCGYSFPIEIPKEYNSNFYLSQGFSAWGYGTWKEKFLKIDWNFNSISRFLLNPLNVINLNSYQYHLFKGLMFVSENKVMHGDRIICFNNIIHNTYSVFPTVTKVKNTGHDGTGANSIKASYSHIFHDQIIDNNKVFVFSDFDVKLEKKIKKALKKHILMISNLHLIKRILILPLYFVYLLKRIFKTSYFFSKEL